MLHIMYVGDVRTHMLRSHYRNFSEYKGLAVLNSELSKLKSINFYRNFRQGIFPRYFNHYILPFVGYWHRLENQKISLVKTTEHLSKAADYLFRTKDFKESIGVKILSCKSAVILENQIMG